MWHLLGISDDKQKKICSYVLLKLREVCLVLEIMEGTNSLFGQALLMSKLQLVIRSVLICHVLANFGQHRYKIHSRDWKPYIRVFQAAFQICGKKMITIKT